MSNVFTLDALREETLKRYEPVEVILSDGSSTKLAPALRLAKKDRDAVLAAIEEINNLDEADDDDDDEIDAYAESVCDAVEKILKLISDKPKKLLAELDHEDPRIKVSLVTAVLSRWMGETQLGEAESSPV